MRGLTTGEWCILVFLCLLNVSIWWWSRCTDVTTEILHVPVKATYKYLSLSLAVTYRHVLQSLRVSVGANSHL